MVYEITAVATGFREWNSQQGGQFFAYKITLKDPTGRVHENVEWSRKSSSAAPQVGESVEGELETKTVNAASGPFQVTKFRKAQQAGSGGFRPRDPKETAAIQRQHSQSVAVEYLKYRATLGGIPDEWKTRDGLRDLIDWFQRDIEHGVRLALYGSPLPETRRDLERTGVSDLPEDAPTHPPVDAEGLPFTGAPA